MAYFALANKAKPPMTIAETHGQPNQRNNTRRVSRPRPHTQKAEPEPAAARRSHDRLPAAAGRSSGSWFGEIGDPMLDEKERDSRH